MTLGHHYIASNAISFEKSPTRQDNTSSSFSFTVPSRVLQKSNVDTLYIVLSFLYDF